MFPALVLLFFLLAVEVVAAKFSRRVRGLNDPRVLLWTHDFSVQRNTVLTV